MHAFILILFVVGHPMRPSILGHYASLAQCQEAMQPPYRVAPGDPNKGMLVERGGVGCIEVPAHATSVQLARIVQQKAQLHAFEECTAEGSDAGVDPTAAFDACRAAVGYEQ